MISFTRLRYRYRIALLQPDQALAQRRWRTRFQAGETAYQRTGHRRTFRALGCRGRTESSEHGGLAPGGPYRFATTTRSASERPIPAAASVEPISVASVAGSYATSSAISLP